MGSKIKQQTVEAKVSEDKKAPRAPRFVLNEKILKEIELLGGHGATVENLRIYYGVSERKFRTLCEKDSRIVDAIFRGRTKTVFGIAGLLIEKARAGNVAAMIFYLKTQGHWKENHEIGLSAISHDKIIPKKLGTDPVEASRIYLEVMK